MEFSFADIAQIIVALITTIGAIVSAVIGGGVRGKELPAGHTTQPPPSSSGRQGWWWGMWLSIGVGLINAALLGWRWLPPLFSGEVVITYPADQARVDQVEIVRGTAQRLPPGQVVWVVVFVPEVGRYYPQDRPADLQADNEWSSTAHIGIPSDTGRRFDVLAVLANAEVQTAFNAYLAEAEERGEWAGLEALPAGVVIYDRVTVIRR
jgi:hypothetical protein